LAGAVPFLPPFPAFSPSLPRPPLSSTAPHPYCAVRCLRHRWIRSRRRESQGRRLHPRLQPSKHRSFVSCHFPQQIQPVLLLCLILIVFLLFGSVCS
jgi:hypothetical protein